MGPMYVSIRLPETGNHIKQLLKTSGYTVKDIQSAMGFENPQAIYKWMSGKSLPSLDNLLILSKILHSSMEDILVVDGDVVLYTGLAVEIEKSLKPCGFKDFNNQIIVSSSKKSRMPIFRIPWSSYHLLRMSWRTMIFGKESPVRVKGLFSVRAFSSVSNAYAD